MYPNMEVRQTDGKGRGVFALERIRNGILVATCTGELRKTDEVLSHQLVMQVGKDQWLCSDGDQFDDCFNHSCEPNIGFVHGDLSLFTLRDIEPGEEICWDYSTSLSEPGWTLNCLCDSPRCRGIVRSFGELTGGDQKRLRAISLSYLREPRG